MRPIRRLGHAIRRPLVELGEGRDDALRLAIGRAESRTVRRATYDDLREAEFKVFSQFGEDGIIQYLIGKVDIADDTFVEIGVEDYRECNTRFLMMNDGWRGFAFDVGSAHIDHLRRAEVRWRHAVEPHQAHVTAENVDDVLRSAGVAGDIGLLSIDIDGNDIWVLRSLSVVRPRIIVAEYNSVLGHGRPVAVPYDPAFSRTEAHWSNLYWGASLPALAHVAAEAGYDLVVSNSAGNNAFFVRRDVRGDLPAVSAAQAWVRSRFRESRDRSGAMTFIDSHQEGLDLIGHLPLQDVVTGERCSVAQLRAR